MKTTLPPPSKQETLPIQILTPSQEQTPGTLAIQHWDDSIRRSRAVKKCWAIYSKILLMPVAAIFVHVLVIPTVITLIVSIIALPFLFIYFQDQRVTWDGAGGKCSYCQKESPTQFRPYLKPVLAERITLLCTGCGQTSQATLELSDELKALLSTK